jgi:hypothetical protein
MGYSAFLRLRYTKLTTYCFVWVLKTLSLTLREERRSGVFGKNVPSRTLGPMREEETGD